MKYEYTHFIPENVAPKGATRIVVKKGDEEVASIPASRFGGLSRPSGEPLYSFGLVSDCHTFTATTSWDGTAKLENALAYFISVGCDFVVGCGDFTQTGFYLDTTAASYNEGQMLKYKEILDSRAIPVYEIYGNHENYNGFPIVPNLARAKELTGIPHTAYTLSRDPDSDTVEGTTVRPNRCVPSVGEDLYIMIGQSESAKPMSDSDFAWLKHILAANTDRRCLLCIHSFIDDDWGDKTAEQRDSERPREDDPAQDNAGGLIHFSDSGNPCGARGNAIFGWWEDYAVSTLAEFLDTLKKYPNVMIFHGHSHMKFESQTFDKCANYTDKNGFKSVHVPSLGCPRHLRSTDGDWTTVKGADGWTEPESQCYRADVYPDCVVLNGLELGTTGVPSVEVLGTLKINTKETIMHIHLLLNHIALLEDDRKPTVKYNK